MTVLSPAACACLRLTHARARQRPSTNYNTDARVKDEAQAGAGTGGSFLDGDPDGCVCTPLCEWPCWQRVGLTDQACCADCQPLPPMSSSDQSDSGLCGARPFSMTISCLLDDGHAGRHRWWDKESIVTWTPHSEPWRNDPEARVAFDEAEQ